MWLPKEERKLLKSYYNKSGKTRESFELPIYEAMEILGLREDKASAPATNEMFDIALNANCDSQGLKKEKLLKDKFSGKFIVVDSMFRKK